MRSYITSEIIQVLCEYLYVIGTLYKPRKVQTYKDKECKNRSFELKI